MKFSEFYSVFFYVKPYVFNKKWTKTTENAFKKIKNKTVNEINTYRRMKRWNVCSEVTFKCIDTIMSNRHFVFFALSSRLGRQVLGAQNRPSISKTASIIITLSWLKMLFANQIAGLINQPYLKSNWANQRDFCMLI